MATIQDYLEAAKGAIISGSTDRAITLCTEVLEHYPKHLEAHCLLAEAHRERGDTRLAEDIFCRVLSAEPERLIARWALSILHDRRGEHDVAIKQLQIALELSPDHTELRRELVRLSGEKVRITIGGLARLYLRGGLFDRAASEFRVALQREPQRLDLLVGLAEVLWRDGRDDEALETCRRILDDSPDCLKALVISAFLEADRRKGSGDCERLLQAARALDPEDLLASDLARQMGVDAVALGLLLGPLALPDSDRADLEPPTPATPEPEALPADRTFSEPCDAPHGATLSLDPAHETSAAKTEDRTVVSTLRPVSPDDAVQEPVTPPEPPATARGIGPADDVPAWLSGSSVTDASAPEEPQDWGEWRELLNEDIALDREAEERLTAALSEAAAQSGRDSEVSPAGGAARADQDGHDDSAEFEKLRQAVADAPTDHDARLALASRYLDVGQANGAVAEYRALLAAAPQLVDKVADGLQRIVRREPGNSEAHRALGDAFMKIGRFQQAIDEYNQAVSLKRG